MKTILKNISRLKNTKIDLDNLIFSGIRLGDSVSKINKDIIIESTYNWIVTSSGVGYRFDFSNTIVEVVLRPKLFKAHNFYLLDDIEKQFGRADAVEKRDWKTFFFYEKANFVVAWNTDSDSFGGLYLGEISEKQTEYTAKKFINTFFKFKRLVPNRKHWNTESLLNNEPRLYLFKELNSLMLAFNIGTCLYKDFERFAFLEQRPITLFKDLEKEINALNSKTTKRTNGLQFRMIYLRYLGLLERYAQFSTYNNETIAICSTEELFYSKIVIDDVVNQINATKLNGLLNEICKVIAPKGECFSKYELITNYNFPNVDMEKLRDEYL